MWLTVLKVSLIAWLAVAVAVMVMVGIRRSRRNRSDPNWSRGAGALPGYAASIRGAMPATPRPEWVDWDEDQPEPAARDDKTAHLQSEVNRLAAKLNVDPIKVGVILRDDDRNIFVDDDGRYHYNYWERGRSKIDRVGEIDDVLYWFANDIAFDIGGSYAARHVPRAEDSRTAMWAKQYEVLNQLDPRWAKRSVRDTADRLRGWGRNEDVKLLPDIPERDG
jgi:Immunity protein 63